jgi:hypothetical protein
MTTKKLSHTSPGVAHHLPHRTRLRLAKHHRKAKTLAAVQARLKKVPGVKDVEINERTGSVLVHHEENHNVLELMGTALEEVATDLFEAVLEVEEAEVPGLSIAAHMLKSRFSKLDTSLANATSNAVDLKAIVPLALLGLGVYKLLKDRAWWGEMPAFVLFYYAFDSYMKFHGPSVRPISVTERVENPPGHLQNPVREELRRRRETVS